MYYTGKALASYEQNDVRHWTNLDTLRILSYTLFMAEALSPHLEPKRETEPERQRRTLNALPEPLQNAARALAEVVPVVRDIAEGNPHTVVQKAVARVRDALRPSQS